MELRGKYKLTEVGLIPDDWKLRSIQSLIDDTEILEHIDGNHGELYPRSNEFVEDGIPYISATDFVSGTVKFNGCKYLTAERCARFQKGIAKNGDILFAHNATVGPVAFLETQFEFVILSTTATLFRVDNERLLNQYLRYVLQAAGFVKQYQAVMSQSTRFQVPITTQRKFKIPIPPTKAEQTAIATALSDMDNLLAGLEKLIEKKKAIKQGAMQELLRPKEGWVVKRLGEIAAIYTGSRNNQDKVEDGEFPFFVRSQTIERIDSYSYEGEAILVPGEGNIGKIFHYIQGKFDFHQRVYKISDFKDGYSGKYIFRYMSENFGKHALENSVKATVDSLRLPTFQDFEIPFPSSTETQLDISSILSRMDEEISAIEIKLEKYKFLKQGMMQELLTGKTRLV